MGIILHSPWAHCMALQTSAGTVRATSATCRTSTAFIHGSSATASTEILAKATAHIALATVPVGTLLLVAASTRAAWCTKQGMQQEATGGSLPPLPLWPALSAQPVTVQCAPAQPHPHLTKTSTPPWPMQVLQHNTFLQQQLLTLSMQTAAAPAPSASTPIQASLLRAALTEANYRLSAAGLAPVARPQATSQLTVRPWVKPVLQALSASPGHSHQEAAYLMNDMACVACKHHALLLKNWVIQTPASHRA